jgi:hypothetical protein
MSLYRSWRHSACSHNVVNALLASAQRISVITAPASSPSPASSTTTLTAHARLLLLHDSDLLRTHPIHAHVLSKALSTTGSRRWLELSLRVRRLSSKSSLSAETWASWLWCVPAAAHHRHERVHVHLTRINALRHHLHHLVHARHTRWCWTGHSWHAWHPTTRITTTHTQHCLHLHVLILLLRDCAGHALLSHAVLRPCVFVEAIVEEIGLIGSRQAPEFGVLGEVCIDVEESDGLVDAWPVGVGVQVDVACADLREVFALFAVVCGCASYCCRARSGCCVFGLLDFGGR